MHCWMVLQRETNVNILNKIIFLLSTEKTHKLNGKEEDEKMSEDWRKVYFRYESMRSISYKIFQKLRNEKKKSKFTLILSRQRRH